MERERSWWQALGPGLLWAGTAVGVSHLVQSTRAGAGYSLALLWLIIAANVFKYPAFEAGPRYTAATGTSLLEGYRLRGRWVVVAFMLLTVSTMFTVLAGVTIVTAGMATALLPLGFDLATWSAILLAASVALLGLGRFRALEGFMTAMMLLLTASTLLAVALLVPSIDPARLVFTPLLPPSEPAHLMFVASLVGWMPSAIDIAVWQSLWALEKQRTTGVAVPWRHARLDFEIGYWGTTFLAALFVVLGAATLFGTGQAIPDNGAAFAGLLIDVYAGALGEWARPLILVAAFTTMLSTTVAVADGFPRALEAAWQRLAQPESALGERSPVYWVALLGSAWVAWAIIWAAAGSLRSLVDLATALTGLTAPALAALNLWAISGPEVPASFRPSPLYRAFHLAGIGFLLLMAALYLTARFAA